MFEIRKNLVPEEQRKEVIKDCSRVPFGRQYTDHMFVMEYNEGKWQTGEIKKLENLNVHPGSIVFHYAQEIFEGAKCFRAKDGRFVLFRIDQNIARMNRSAKKLCIPELDPALFDYALRELIKVDARHIPDQDGCSLYIRPFIIATEDGFGVRSSKKYLFIIMLSPVGPYFPEGFKPTKIYATQDHARAAPKGTGDIKCGGNYAASMAGGEEAKKYGCSQVLWLDAKEHKYVEEVGSMNVFFVQKGIVYTAPLSGTILPGVTRDSVIQLCKAEGIPIREEALTIDEVCTGIESGDLSEIFGSGTACSICPVRSLVFKGKTYTLGKPDDEQSSIGPITNKLFGLLVGIQRGEIPDRWGWLTNVDV